MVPAGMSPNSSPAGDRHYLCLHFDCRMTCKAALRGCCKLAISRTSSYVCAHASSRAGAHCLTSTCSPAHVLVICPLPAHLSYLTVPSLIPGLSVVPVRVRFSCTVMVTTVHQCRLACTDHADARVSSFQNSASSPASRRVRSANRCGHYRRKPNQPKLNSIGGIHTQHTTLPSTKTPIPDPAHLHAPAKLWTVIIQWR